MKSTIYPIVLSGMVLATMIGCNGDSSTPADDSTTIETPAPPSGLGPPLTADCRPVDHEWDPDTEPMLLPCKPTFEPCDGIDNDKDGITDPHCPTMPCSGGADCTYGGLLPDADCNVHVTPSHTGEQYPPGACNQIDGMPPKANHHLCWGQLCPPTLKCVLGDCIEPGTGLPGTPCTGGGDCPLNAGCIPTAADGGPGSDIGRCIWFCDWFPCPNGLECIEESWTHPSTGKVGVMAFCQE